jgi:hypothetical protein
MTHSILFTPTFGYVSNVPNKTTDACHDVDIGDAAPIKQHPYWLNPLKREVMRNETTIFSL